MQNIFGDSSLALIRRENFNLSGLNSPQLAAALIS
jgi:hypothetical protein